MVALVARRLKDLYQGPPAGGMFLYCRAGSHFAGLVARNGMGSLWACYVYGCC